MLFIICKSCLYAPTKEITPPFLKVLSSDELSIELCADFVYAKIKFLSKSVALCFSNAPSARSFNEIPRLLQMQIGDYQYRVVLIMHSYSERVFLVFGENIT